MALSAILRAVPSEMLSTVAVKGTAKEAWESVKIMRIGVARVREAKAQTLRNVFKLIRMKESESVDDFSMRLNGIGNNLRMLGEPLEEKVTGHLWTVEERKRPSDNDGDGEGGRSRHGGRVGGTEEEPQEEWHL
ncbi:uncharacterized protein LOC107304079 [Oryza brachyantha]|uniref:uncharacterized protein LOC107304079 n=1 Tax=Oryza brachyantha TaxID=4533 RepID=UPI0007762914|nr:uncharacterized protein LOC107304079 [Oryza brachyantha]